MNALDLLRDQHQETGELLERLHTTEDVKQRRELLVQVGRVLRTHMFIEEKVFYPAAQRALHDDEIILESYEEHAIARSALEKLEGTPNGDKRFAARVKALKDVFHHHREEEEHNLFPRVEDEVGEQELSTLGEQLEKRARTAPVEAPRRGVTTVRRAPARSPAVRARSTRSASTPGPKRGTTAARGRKASGRAGAKAKRGTRAKAAAQPSRTVAPRG